MGARLTDQQKEYILKSPESANRVAKLTGITEGHIRYIRRLNEYKIQHKGHGRAYIDGVEVDTSGFDMEIPENNRGHKPKNDAVTIDNFLYR